METLFSSVADLRRMMSAYESGQTVLLPALDTPQRQDAYVSGVDLGLRAVRLLELHRAYGIGLEEDVVLAGMVDAFRRHVRLSSCEREESMLRVNARVTHAMTPSASAPSFARQERSRYERFLQAPGLCQGLDGMLYVLTEPGYGQHIQDSDTVALLLTGTLADGTCFEPRGALGIVQDIAVPRLYPPLQQVVKRLRWGGEAQVLIPAFSLTTTDPGESVSGCVVNLYFDVKVKRKG
ncbi:TPA: hypothetical protein ACGR4L_004303 [Serratia marcescens]|uniref:hypothetical protein n=1 Tax=Serratia marcescens TaxID=615 RepID=UPI0009526B33|nr:hypothetical protein [Serratia marcescens]